MNEDWSRPPDSHGRERRAADGAIDRDWCGCGTPGRSTEWTS